MAPVLHLSLYPHVISTSTHKGSRVHFLALWLWVWPHGLLWSTGRSSGDSHDRLRDEAIRGLVWLCFLSWPLPPPWEKQDLSADPGRKMKDLWITATAGSGPNQAPSRWAKSPASADTVWEINAYCWKPGTFCAIMQQYCGQGWLTPGGIYFLFQDNFKCKLES